MKSQHARCDGVADAGLAEPGPRAAGPARYASRGGDGEAKIGIITSVSQPLCGDCSRARLAADSEPQTDGVEMHKLGGWSVPRGGLTRVSQLLRSLAERSWI